MNKNKTSNVTDKLSQTETPNTENKLESKITSYTISPYTKKDSNFFGIQGDSIIKLLTLIVICITCLVGLSIITNGIVEYKKTDTCVVEH